MLANKDGCSCWEKEEIELADFKSGETPFSKFGEKTLTIETLVLDVLESFCRCVGLNACLELFSSPKGCVAEQASGSDLEKVGLEAGEGKGTPRPS